jgi:hypothetical protein
MARSKIVQDDTEGFDENLETNPDAWRRWPGRANAPGIVGITKRRFRELLDQQRIQEFEAPDGSLRYSPRDLRALADEVALEDPVADETSRTTVGGIAIDTAKAAGDLLKQNQGHLERIVEVMLRGYDKGMTAMAQALDFATRQNVEMRREIDTAKQKEAAQDIEMLQANTDAAVRLQQEERRTFIVSEMVPKLAPVLGTISEAVKNSVEKLQQPRPTQTETVTTKPTTTTTLKDAIAVEAVDLVESIGVEGLQSIRPFVSGEQGEKLDRLLTKLGNETPEEKTP